MVAPASDACVSEVELRHIAQSLQYVWGHSGVEDHAHRLTTLAALDAARDLLDDTGAQVLLDLELGVLGELKGIGLVAGIVRPYEDIGEAVAQHVVEEHEVALAALILEAEEAPQRLCRHLQEGDLVLLLGLRGLVPQDDRQVECLAEVALRAEGRAIDEDRARRTIDLADEEV